MVSTSPLQRKLWMLYAAGAAAFLPVLGLYYVGEEAIFPLVSLEMWHHGEWLRQIMYGQNLQHNPLFNWIIILACQLVGWEYVLAVARTVTVGATVGSGLVLAWLAGRVTGDREFAALSAVLYLMLADVVLYRGWIAYVDPLFSFFVFASIACLWVACRERRLPLLALAVAAVVTALLAKAFTAFVFYGVAAFVFAWEREARRFLLRPASLAIHVAGAAAVGIWFGVILAKDGQDARMFQEIVDKLALVGTWKYFAKFFTYPVETFLKLSPAALLGGYYAWTRRSVVADVAPVLRTAVAIAALNYLPYWLAPQSHSRYLLPLYPLVALICACVIWRARPASVAVTLRWFYAMLAVKLVFVLVAFPYYQKVYRGENYLLTARAIIAKTAGQTLYSSNVSASGLSVKAYIDVARLPEQPLMYPPVKWESGFLIAYTPDPAQGRVVEKYRLGGNVLYLLCRGKACDAGVQ